MHDLNLSTSPSYDIIEIAYIFSSSSSKSIMFSKTFFKWGIS